MTAQVGDPRLWGWARQHLLCIWKKKHRIARQKANETNSEVGCLHRAMEHNLADLTTMYPQEGNNKDGAFVPFHDHGSWGKHTYWLEEEKCVRWFGLRVDRSIDWLINMPHGVGGKDPAQKPHSYSIAEIKCTCRNAEFHFSTRAGHQTKGKKTRYTNKRNLGKQRIWTPSRSCLPFFGRKKYSQKTIDDDGTVIKRAPTRQITDISVTKKSLHGEGEVATN